MKIRSYLDMTSCPGCDHEYNTRPRLIQHLLYDAPACGEFLWGLSPPPPGPERVAEFDQKDAELARDNRNEGTPKRAKVPRT